MYRVAIKPQEPACNARTRPTLPSNSSQTKMDTSENQTDKPSLQGNVKKCNYLQFQSLQKFCRNIVETYFAVSYM